MNNLFIKKIDTSKPIFLNNQSMASALVEIQCKLNEVIDVLNILTMEEEETNDTDEDDIMLLNSSNLKNTNKKDK